MLNDDRILIPILTVAGTHGYDGRSAGWDDPEQSPLMAYWRANGFVPRLGADGQGFCWSTSLDGFNSALRVWRASAENLIDWCIPPMAPQYRIPGAVLHAVVHSHGLQPVLIACAKGLRINVLVSFGSPVREDVIAQYGAAARKNISYWIHVHSDGTDWWQWLGELMDGHLGIVREQKHPVCGADLNWSIKGVGHTQLLTRPELFPHVWPQIFDIIRARHGNPNFLVP